MPFSVTISPGWTTRSWPPLAVGGRSDTSGERRQNQCSSHVDKRLSKLCLGELVLQIQVEHLKRQRWKEKPEPRALMAWRVSTRWIEAFCPNSVASHKPLKDISLLKHTHFDFPWFNWFTWLVCSHATLVLNGWACGGGNYYYIYLNRCCPKERM